MAPVINIKKAKQKYHKNGDPYWEYERYLSVTSQEEAEIIVTNELRLEALSILTNSKAKTLLEMEILSNKLKVILENEVRVYTGNKTGVVKRFKIINNHGK